MFKNGNIEILVTSHKINNSNISASFLIIADLFSCSVVELYQVVL